MFKSELNTLVSKVVSFRLNNWICAGIIVSLDKIQGYHAFVIVILPSPLPPPPKLLHRFLVCTLHPRVLLPSFSSSGHMSLVPTSKHQSILGALLFQLWPLQNQMCFSCILETSLHILTKYVLNQGLGAN